MSPMKPREYVQRAAAGRAHNHWIGKVVGHSSSVSVASARCASNRVAAARITAGTCPRVYPVCAQSFELRQCPQLVVGKPQ